MACTGNVTPPPGKSASGIIDLTVLSGFSTPPDGTLINLSITDVGNGVSVSRNVTVQSAPEAGGNSSGIEAGLALSIPNGTVAPGESFTTTLTYHNYSAGPLSGLQLSALVPAGASFVPADGGGALSNDVS